LLLSCPSLLPVLLISHVFSHCYGHLLSLHSFPTRRSSDLIFEWNTIPLVNNALENGKTITFPKANPKTREMDFYAINQIDELKPGYAGIYEPDPEITTYKNKSEIDLLIVPGLVF